MEHECALYHGARNSQPDRQNAKQPLERSLAPHQQVMPFDALPQLLPVIPRAAQILELVRQHPELAAHLQGIVAEEGVDAAGEGPEKEIGNKLDALEEPVDGTTGLVANGEDRGEH